MAIERIGKGFEFDKSLAAYAKFQNTAPKVVANNSKNWFVKGFRQGGGQTDASKSGWAPRKPSTKRNTGRGILVDKGHLWRSIMVAKATFKEILIKTEGIPYADRHNEGLTDKLGRKMPKREFMGKSKGLDESNKKILVNLLRKVFK